MNSEAAQTGTSAAFFDLDRTLLASSSAPVYAKVLADLGTVDMRIPAEALYFQLYTWFGEDPLTMRLARQGSRIFAGHRVETVRRGGRMAAEILARDLLPFAQAEIERHRRNGTMLVLATTSHFDLVEALAEELNFDAVLATRYRSIHGIYDGTLDGSFVWNDEKARAVARWSAENDIDLQSSWAYSDSIYDVPMLELVGNPVAVNPDARLRVTATARRWTVRSFANDPSINRLAGFELQDALLPFAPGLVQLFSGLDVTGLENVPASGGAILAANHRSYFDPLAIGALLSQAGRPGRFLAKQELFDKPILGDVIRALGTIPVDRGSGSSSPLDRAAHAIDGGDLVVLLPEGTIPRGQEFFAPKLKGRPGVARLAEMTGAPIVPIGLWGTEAVWPRNENLPQFVSPQDRPRIQIRVGEPLVFLNGSGSSHRKNTDIVMEAIVDLLPEEARRRRTPTEAELAATMPAGGSKRSSAKG